MRVAGGIVEENVEDGPVVEKLRTPRLLLVRKGGESWRRNVMGGEVSGEIRV